MTRIDKTNMLYEKYKDLTEGMFHNTLWQLLVNNVREGVQSAFTYIYVPSVKGGTNVGIADYGAKGYTPCPFSIKRGVPVLAREQMIEELNREIFGITEEKAFEIVCSSMRP